LPVGTRLIANQWKHLQLCGFLGVESTTDRFREAKMMLANLWSLLRQTFDEWSKDGAPRLGAALAYYSVFSLGPLLIIAIGVASMFFEGGAVQQQVMGQVRSLVGEQGAQTVGTMLAGSSTGHQSLIATVVGAVVLIFGALSVVVQLKDALNIIWDVENPPISGIWGYVRTYVLSLAAILALGFLLTISLMSSALIAGFGQALGSGLSQSVAFVGDFVLNFLVLILLFAMMFKYLPDIEIGWRDVWIGAVLTAMLFNLGKFLIGLYLGYQGMESTYGAAASVVLILIWIYYSAQIVFFGAEFTQVYARRYGSHREFVRQERTDRVSPDASISMTGVGIAAATGLVLGAILARG
jgi:membrane protein